MARTRKDVISQAVYDDVERQLQTKLDEALAPFASRYAAEDLERVVEAVMRDLARNGQTYLQLTGHYIRHYLHHHRDDPYGAVAYAFVKAVGETLGFPAFGLDVAVRGESAGKGR